MTRFRIRIPASTSNLGPGFDTIGMALKLYNAVTIEPGEKGIALRVRGKAGRPLALPEVNLFYGSLDATCRDLGICPAVRATQKNDVPVRRGLGGSGTAVLAGVAAGLALAGREIAQDEVLARALVFEGHPDNITPSLVGGLTTSVVVDGHVRWLKITVPEDLKAVLCVPDQPIATELARRALPSKVPHEDAVFNVRAAAMLVAAMASGEFEKLGVAMQDRLHQQYRRHLLPGMEAICEAAVGAGAHGAALSGAGSSIVALATREHEKIGHAMCATAKQYGLRARSMTLAVDNTGMVIEQGGGAFSA